ncbi:MAG TPA: heparinase II/III family protein, partial [Planctomycetota bacterium]|nr:heparinase II/III family protein [Planctomycetota bacterium]
MDRRSTITGRARKLRDFPSSRLPEATDETLKQAETIASGKVFFYRHEPVAVGLKDIDWEGHHIVHQEWPAQLNRFGYLATLAAAWRATGDAKFPAAARAYIEDWIDHHP